MSTVAALSVALAVAIGIALYLIGALKTVGNAYAAEKGKNYATKEDVADIEREIEKVRAEGQAHQLINRSQYEIELTAYREVWSTLAPAVRSVQSLRPVLDSMASDKNAEQERQGERLKAFADTYHPFGEAVWKHRPFYSPTVFDELVELLRLLRLEAIQYGDAPPATTDRSYWDRALENSKRIDSQVNKLCESIRARLSSARVSEH